jgi:hypothetical protein
MTSFRLASLFLLCSLLAGCERAADDGSDRKSSRNGRYVGIGIFEAGTLWSQVKTATTADDPSKASLADDDHIIVLVDTKTGEVRECGDYSGYCLSMTPWTKVLDPSQSLPIHVAKHLQDIGAEAVEVAPQKK